MKSRLKVALLLAALIGALAYWLGIAFWLGYRQGSITSYMRLSQQYAEQEQERWRKNSGNQAHLCLSALTNLALGNQLETRAVLEQHLNQGVRQLVSTWENPPAHHLGIPEILLLRAVRDYRLQHPWTNDRPGLVEGLNKAFKILDESAQVQRLKRHDQMMSNFSVGIYTLDVQGPLTTNDKAESNQGVKRPLTGSSPAHN